MNKVTIEFARNPDEPQMKETIELSGERVGHRIEEGLQFPVVTIWANVDNLQRTVTVINPPNGALVRMENVTR